MNITNEANHVMTLAELAADRLAENPLLISKPNEKLIWELCPSIALPQHGSELLLRSFMSNSLHLSCSKILNLFIDGQRTPLSCLDLSGTPVNDATLVKLVHAHAKKLTVLNVASCANLTDALNSELGARLCLTELQVLNLGSLVILFRDWASSYDKPPLSTHLESHIALRSSNSAEDMESDDMEGPSSPFPDSVTPASDAQMLMFDSPSPCTTSVGGTTSNASQSNRTQQQSSTSVAEVHPNEILNPRITRFLRYSPDRMNSHYLLGRSGSVLARAIREGRQQRKAQRSASAKSLQRPLQQQQQQHKYHLVQSTSLSDSSVHTRSTPSPSWMHNNSDELSDETQVDEDRMSTDEEPSLFADDDDDNAKSKLRDSNQMHDSNFEDYLMSIIGLDGNGPPIYYNSITGSCPNLLALILYGDTWDSHFPELRDDRAVAGFFHVVLEPLLHLQYLDISYWSYLDNLRFLLPLRDTLQTLILFNVPDLYKAHSTICQLHMLRHLDLSQSETSSGIYPTPARKLFDLVNALPYLKSLDLSCTNLPSHPAEEGDWADLKKRETILSDIAGLRGLHQPLDYLGLFGVENSASHFAHIPAKNIAGDKNEDQVLLALEQYMERCGLLRKALNETYQVFRYGDPHNHLGALKLVLFAVERHVTDTSVQISGSASLFYIIKSMKLPSRLKSRVINAFLAALEKHTDEQVLVRNCCLSLCQFEIPHDIMNVYMRTVILMLKILETHTDDLMTQRIIVYLLNSMACHVDGVQKKSVGKVGTIEKILDLIRSKEECDEVLEVSWSFLWNVTDETPSNCACFLDNNGMDLFHSCLQKFPNESELLRNMMGLMGNIAEVKELRPRLMHNKFLSAFCNLLNNMTDGIEISYNSAGVLAHLCSDGNDAWKRDGTYIVPSRAEVTASLIRAMNSWNLDTKRFINYRSFEPIIRLLPLYDSQASQQWAVWALANLTTVDGSKYCQFILDEGGLPILQVLLHDRRPSDIVIKLTKLILDNIDKWVVP